MCVAVSKLGCWIASIFFVICRLPLRDQTEAFGVSEVPSHRFKHALECLACKGVTAVMVMDDSQPTVLMHVDPPSCPSGSAEREAGAFKSVDEFADGKIPEKVDKLARLAHTTTARAGASITSPLGGGCGMGRPASRRVVM